MTSTERQLRWAEQRLHARRRQIELRSAADQRRAQQTPPRRVFGQGR